MQEDVKLIGTYDTEPATPEQPSKRQEHVIITKAGLRRKSRSMHDFKGVWGASLRSTQHKKRPMRWLILHERGGKQVLTLEKRQVIQGFNLDVPMRDMRLLDKAIGSQYSNYETLGQISIRERAIIFSMEQVKMLIMVDRVIIPLEETTNEVKEKFISFLEQGIQERAAQLQENGSGNADHEEGYGEDLGKLFDTTDKEILPFELHVLESALGEICNLLAREVDVLQAQAQPALEEMTRNADQPTLERVRRIKTRHQRLICRVKLVSEVLERLLEDDGDMLRMCLSKSVMRRGGTESLNARLGGLIQPMRSADSGTEALPPVSQQQPPSAASLKHSFSAERKRRGASSVEDLDDALERGMLLDVENLLETYFMLVDSTHQRLLSVGEYIDDFEDLTNIQLDYARNKLIRFDIILTTGAFAITIFNAVAGLLGENVQLPSLLTSSIWSFAVVNVLVLGFCGLVFLAILRNLSKNNLL